MKSEVLNETGGGGNPAATPPQGYKPVEFLNGWAEETVNQVAPNVRYAATLGLPQLEFSKHVRPGKAVIVASAPSVMEHIEEIRELSKDKRNWIWAINKSYGLLLKNGIIPTAHCLMEIAPRGPGTKHCYDCLDNPHPALTYYVASLCDKSTFDALKGYNVVLWHCHSEVWEHVKALNESFGTFEKGIAKSPMMVGGGFTTFLRTLSVSYLLGFRDYELFGVDSSFAEGETSHFFGTPEYGGGICDCHAAVGPNDELRHFWSMPYLIRQADEFKSFCENHNLHLKIRVHGDGLLPAIHRKLQPLMYED